jgi:type IV secretory pathway TraG/TraD family ATPase VirD4
VIIPALLAHLGAAVSTSTKPDVLAATAAARSRVGKVWHFDPTGSDSLPEGGALRWSPVTGAGSWDGALSMARAMVGGARVGAGTTDQTHWSRRASALLAPLLHAAAIAGHSVGHVVDWVLRHELDEPGVILQHADAKIACGVLIGLQSTEARERSSIFSAAADALEAYTAHGALAAASQPNFDADRFVRSADTIYIHAAAEGQALAAPLVCGLLSEIRRATYQAHHERALRGRVLFALDEAANIAPLQELPQIASEGGGQGLQLLAAFQDLSQARARWGVHADGFLTLFGAKLILPGVADSQTLEQISLALGEYDRQVISTTKTRQPGMWPAAMSTSRTVSTHRQRVLAPGDVANIPPGKALYLDGLSWQLLAVTPAHRTEPWRTLTQRETPAPARQAIAGAGGHGWC